LVAYIYDELSAAGRETFERHLLDCSGCTSELADISLARLGVYEWHRDEFVPLETPHFVIPEEPRAVATPKYSLIEIFRGFLSSPMRLATAGGAFAIFAFAATFGLLFKSGPVPQVADSQQTISSPIPQSEKPEQRNIERTVAEQRNEEVGTPAPKREFRPAKSEQRVQAVQINAKRSSNQPKLQTTSARSAPRLGNFVETEDKSLRLADLVADIDTKD
jgi:hypothetical protein